MLHQYNLFLHVKDVFFFQVLGQLVFLKSLGLFLLLLNACLQIRIALKLLVSGAWTSIFRSPVATRMVLLPNGPVYNFVK